MENPENNSEVISTNVRLAIGIPLIFIFCGIAAFFYFFGMGLGVMATDGCGGNEIPTVVSFYLTLAWPAVMGLTSFVPALMFIIKGKFALPIISLLIGIVISSLWYAGWFFIVSYYCGGSV